MLPEKTLVHGHCYANIIAVEDDEDPASAKAGAAVAA